MTTGKLSRRAVLAAGLSGILFPNAVWPQSTERDVEGGIGGTGIVGVLTDFGSLIVGGNAVQIDRSTAFSDGFGTLVEADMKLGHSLTVEASRKGDAMIARRVHVTYPLVGEISEISPEGRRLIVNGVRVEMERAQRGFAPGDRVAVSGLWRDRGVVGSLLTDAPSPLDLISGDVSRGRGSMRIGALDVRGFGLSSLENGSFASGAGRFDKTTGRLQITDLTTARFTGAAGRLQRLSIEGYLDPIATAPGYRIAGLGHSLERDLNLRAYAETRALFTGAYTGRFAASSALVLPVGLESRRQVLRRLSQT